MSADVDVGDFVYDQIVKEHLLEVKAVEDVLGGEEAWANVDRTEGAPACFPVVACS